MDDDFETKGWKVFRGVVDKIDYTLLDRLCADLQTVYDLHREIQKRNGVDFPGVAHHMIKSLWAGSSFRELLEGLEYSAIKDEIEKYFGAPFILSTFSGIINFPGQTSIYQHRPHRDMRTYLPIPLSLNMLIMLDDFTEKNGATWLLSGSHLREEIPSEEEFFKNAEQITGKAGDIILFNSNVVHATGLNETDKVRCCIPPVFVRSFMKQQCDFTLLVVDSDSEWLKQILGYNSRTARDVNDWYQPVECRMYKPGQG